MRLVVYLLLAGCCILSSLNLYASTFVGGYENNIWSDPRNWSPQQVPGAEAIVPINKHVVVDGAITVGSLILGGTLAGDGDPNSKLTITTGFSWTSGMVTVPVYLGNGCAALWQGNLSLNANLFNSGEVTVSANVSNSYSTLRNEADGVLNLTDGFKFQIHSNPAIIENYGTIRRTGLGGVFQVLLGLINHPGSETIVEAGELYASSLDNYAPINIAAGATFHSYDFRIYNGTAFTGGGLLKSTGNGMYMNNTDLITVEVAETELNSQGIKQTGPITFLHHLNWMGGTLFAQVTFAPGSLVDINPGNGKGITNTTTNHGTINVNDSFGFDIGRLDNHGTMNLNGAFTNGIYHASEGIHNYSVITKPVGAFGTYNMGVQLFNEPGSQLLVQQDELHCSGNLFNSGEIIINAGATLRSNFTRAQDGGTYAGPGAFIIQNNGLTAVNTAPVTLGFSEIVVNSSLSGTGAITLAGHVNWTQGDFAAPVTIAAGSVVDMNPGGGHGISGTTTNNGTLNINTSFTLSAGHIDNNGLLSLNGPHTIGIYYGTPGIFNHGTVIKPSASAGTYNMGVPLTNYSDGSVVVENGELYVSSDFTNAGSLSVSAGATFRANRTRVQDGASFTGTGTYVVFSNGLTAENTTNVNFDLAETDLSASLSGSGPLTFTQHVSWKNANLNCPVTIAAGGILDLTTNGGHGIGNTLTNNGTMNANVSFHSGTVVNNGTLHLAGGITASSTINNAGTLVKNTGGNVSVYFLNNTGSVQVPGENLFLSGLTNAGAIAIAGGANVQLNDYNTNSFETGASLSGAGTFTLAAPLTANGNANIEVQTFVLAATYYGITGTGILTFSHVFDWQSGSVGNTVVLETGGVMNLSGPDFKNLSGTLTNNGTVNCDADLDLYTGAVINNNSAFHLTNGSVFGSYYYFAGEFNNAGSLDKSSPGVLSFNTFLNNLPGGSVSIDQGSMEVGKLDNAGNVTTASGTSLTVNDGSNLAGGTVAGNGLLRIAGNGWNLASSLTINSLTLEIAGNLSSTSATLEVESTATWFSGDISVPVNIAASGVFSTESYGSKYISAALTNNGVFNSNTGWYTDGQVTNNGQFFVRGDGTFANYSGQIFTNTNSGLLKVLNNPYGVYVNIQIVNDGSILVEEGNAYLQNGLTNNAALTIETGAALILGGSDVFNSGSTLNGGGRLEVSNSLTLNTALAFSGEKFMLYGNLQGPEDLTILSDMEWTNGNIETDVTIATGATLEIGGSSGGGGVGSLTASPASMIPNQGKPGPLTDFSTKSRSDDLEKSFYGQTLYASITNNGVTTQDGGYDMDNGIFTNNNLLITNYGGIHDGGNGGVLSNNGTWETNAYFECYIAAANNGTLSGTGELDFEPELENNGTVSPGFSPGQLSFTHHFQNGVQLNMELESSSGPGIGHDYIGAGDNLLLGGALTITETGSLLDGTYTLLHCNGGPDCRTGVFSSTAIPSGYVLSYTGESVILTKGQPIQVSPSDTTVCYGNPTTLTAPEAEFYSWSTGESTQSIEVYPYETSTYYVTVTYAGGGGALGSATVHVADQPYGYIYPYYTYLCQGESVTLDYYGDEGAYSWSSGETTQSITVSPTESTNYYISVTNAAGCTGTAYAYIEVAGQAVTPEITDVPASICQSEPIYLSYYQGGYYGDWSGPGVSYNYFDPTGLSGGQTLTFTPYSGQCATPATWTIEVIPGTTWYVDADADGYGDEATSLAACTQPEGYVSNSSDCNDNNTNINPAATETCNGTDDDCDGQTDEGVGSTWYADADGDGYGNAATTEIACTQPEGYVSNDDDCNDSNANINPAATEVCNGTNDDCDGQTDEGVGSTWYADADGDGYGDAATTQTACTQPEGYVSNSSDCNDNNTNINPAATETCNGTDDDCDGQTDEGIGSTWYADADGDGYGNSATTQTACTQPEGYVSNSSDCNDNNTNINPAATETCNGTDDDCDGQTDEGVGSTWYADADGDGYGNAATTQTACTQPEGYVSNSSDCNDNNTNINPAAAEICNGTDDDCDGQTDEGLGSTWYADADGDGYGNSATTQTACTQPEGYVSNDDDCNDNNANINPAATEICNGTDDDCDGQTDEGVACGTDNDNDGYTTEQGDCNDNPATGGTNIHPGATEICNGVDDDCDGLVDETTLTIDPILVTHVGCNGGNTGAVNITVSGGAPGYTYQWSNNRTTQDIVNVGANTYSVTVTDANGCTAIASATVNPKLALTLTKTNTTCNGGADGTVTANPTGGTPGYTYLWNTGATTQTIDNLGVGSYSVTVTDALGCSRVKSISVGQPAAISVSGVVQNVTCNGAANGSINISHNNGIAPFTYAWSDGATTMDRSNLAPGTYTVTVMDVNGCNRSKTFTITEPDALTLSFSAHQVTCNGSADARITTTTTGGKKFPTSALCNGERYCYNWSNGATSRNLTDLVPGIYGLTVTDANGCTLTGSVTITEPDALDITGVNIVALPNGKYELTVSATGGTQPHKFRRIPGGGYQTSNVLNNVPMGSYQIVVRDANLCTDTVTVSVPGGQNLSIEETEAGDWVENESNESPSIFPNPAAGMFSVKLPDMPESGFIRIFDLSGRVVSEQKLLPDTDLYQFYAEDWQAGMYLVYIQKGQERQTLKLVITE